jgi:hypothetical protein
MPCPGFAVLIDYLDGALSKDETAAISEHLASGCVECAADRNWYERVRSLAAADDSVLPPLWVLKRGLRVFDLARAQVPRSSSSGHLIASLVYDSMFKLGAAGVRSADAFNRQLLYRAAGYSVDVQLSRSAGARAGVVGQILDERAAGFGSVSSLSWELIRGDRLIGSAVTNKFGEFGVDGLDEGEYELRIQAHEGSIVLSGVPVRFE